MKIDRFYCTHYTKLPERKLKLLGDFEKHSIPIIWVEDEPKYRTDLRITQEQYSSVHKHYMALKQFVDDPIASYAMIFEDDVIIDDDFSEYLHRLELELGDSTFDFISVGNVSLFDNNEKYSVVNPSFDKLVYLGGWKTTACAHCMLFSKSFAKWCVDNFDYYAAFDIYLDQYILPKGDFIVGRTYPYIKQSTIDGNVASAIPTQFNGYGTWFGGSR